MQHTEQCAAVAEEAADELEGIGVFSNVDWCDLGEVTLTHKGRRFRLYVHDITNEDD